MWIDLNNLTEIDNLHEWRLHDTTDNAHDILTKRFGSYHLNFTFMWNCSSSFINIVYPLLISYDIVNICFILLHHYNLMTFKIRKYYRTLLTVLPLALNRKITFTHNHKIRQNTQCPSASFDVFTSRYISGSTDNLFIDWNEHMETLNSAR